MTRSSTVLLLAMLVLAGAPTSTSSARAQDLPDVGARSATGAPAGTVDARARRILDSMTRAYRDLRRLEQDTTYGTQADPAPDGLVRSRLVVERPNRIVLEIVQQSAGSPTPLLTRVQCDGKQLYNYRQRNGWFTREKAPKSLADLDYLAFSFEMSALTGGDPVGRLLKQARSITLEAAVVVDGGPADVVAIDTSTPSASGMVRLAIGQQDHLLRRFEVESRPPDPKDAAARPSPKLGPLAGLVPDDPPPPAIATRFVYENHVTVNPKLAKDAFVWVAPAGSFEYQPYPTFLRPDAGATQKGQAAAAAAAMPPGITPRKIISIQDLMKNARKPGQKK